MYPWLEMNFFTLPPSATALAGWLKIIELSGERSALSREREHIFGVWKYEWIWGSEGVELQILGIFHHFSHNLICYVCITLACIKYIQKRKKRTGLRRCIPWSNIALFHLPFLSRSQPVSECARKKRDVDGLLPFWVVNPLPAVQNRSIWSDESIQTVQDPLPLTVWKIFSLKLSTAAAPQSIGQTNRRRHDAHDQLMT